MLRSSLALTASLVLLGACNLGDTPREDRVVTERSPDMNVLVEGNTAFAVDMYQWMASEDEGNLFFSPFSISSALGMTYAGARSTTAEAMEDTLHIGLEGDTFHEQFGMLTRDLDGDKGRGYELSIANRLFGQTGYTFGTDFLAINADHYGAPLEELDFGADPEAARVHINDWVAEQTKDKIDELLVPGVITGDTRLVLTNAIYFKAFWLTQFDEDDTYDGTFRAPSGDVTVPMMNMEIEVEYSDDDEVSVVRLPYEDDEVSMLLVLPHDEDGLADVEAMLSPEQIDAWADSTHPTEIWMAMPSWEMRYKLSLVPALTDLGMGEAFDSFAADFSGITDTGMFIADVIHEAYVKVDEEGTEAAAATAVVMEDGAVGDMFVADHPFLYIIRDDLTGSVLFMGRVADPS